MLPKKQLALIQKTDLSREEQWAMLNARPSIRTLSQIMELRNNRAAYGLSDAELNTVIAQLQKIGDARTNAQNRNFYFANDRARNLFLKMMDEEEEKVSAAVKNGNVASLLPASKVEGKQKTLYNTLNEQAVAAITSAPLSTPIPVNGQAPIPEGNGEKAYIFYTESPGARFEKQAEYQKRLFTQHGYDVESVCIGDVSEFIDGWNEMDSKTGAAVILCHCNGMSLMFEDDTKTNAISAIGKNRDRDPLPAIDALEGPGASLLYLYACNAGHKDLYEQEGTNVADAFRDLPTVDTVYAYDGSVGFGTPVIRFFEREYPPRLSNDQDSYYGVYDVFGVSDEKAPPSGLQIYTDD